MSNVDVVRAWYEASFANPPASLLTACMTYLAEDFKHYGPDGSVELNKRQFIQLGQLIANVLSDYKATILSLEEDPDGIVTMTFRWEGIQTGELDLLGSGLGVFPPSGQRIIWPEATTRFEVEGNQIVSARPVGPKGFERFFEPLGVRLPAA
jgi:hypothetical protein